MKSFKMKAYGQTWNVRVVKKHPKLHKDLLGICLFGDNEILISANAAEDTQRSTLLHEIVELIDSSNELDLDESKVLTLEAGLYSIIHDNRLRF